MMSQLAVGTIFYCIFSAMAIAAERMWPARPMRYLRVLPADIVAAAFYGLVVYPAALAVSDPAFSRFGLPGSLGRDSGIPLALRVLAFYLCADHGSYWMHRLMHTRWIWRIHKYHHSPSALYWLAGVRSTIPQQILFNLPYVIFIPLVAGAPRWVYLALSVEGIFRNHWMHLNVTWRANWIEYVFVSPRYHHIHHSDLPEHHDTNFGSLFTLWDRLYRTRRNPDGAAPAQFGCGDVAVTRTQRVVLAARHMIGF
jgi:sterol desaturase/sphingolipid hydroxylase (fatty acid hydroxylase superfamily)